VTKFLADAIAEYTERPDVSGVLGRVEQLLDESVAANEYLIPASDADALFDLAAVDWNYDVVALQDDVPSSAHARTRAERKAAELGIDLYAPRRRTDPERRRGRRESR
jgi:hypothetical protein